MLAAILVVIITLVGAIFAVSLRSIVRAIFGLALSLLGVALAFLALNSPFVAAMEVLIYIGGITVAMVFAVMLSSVGQDEASETPKRIILSAIVAVLLFAAVAIVLLGAEFGPMPEANAEAWSVQQIGFDLLDRFNVVFELLSVVLLLAIIGAITIAGRHDEDLDPTTADAEGGDA